MNKDINDACVDSSYQFDDFFDDNILSVDYSRNFLAMRLSCYEEEVAALQPLTIDIRNKLSLLTYGHFLKFICLSFDQGFYLKVEKQFEEPLVSTLEPKFKKNSNGEEENVSLYDEYNEHIEILNWKFHDPMDSWMELYFSKVSDAPAFDILPIFIHKYQLPIDSLLHLSHLLWVFSNSSMHGIMILSQMVSWPH